MKTAAVFFPFDLFGSAGTAAGVELLADACREMLADNKREKIATRARAYRGQVWLQEFTFETLAALRDWRQEARRAIREVFQKNQFLLWFTGNHLGALPVYDELAASTGKNLVIQLDAHLDVYNLSDCTRELSHGNFLLHCDGPLPDVINLGHRELLLRPEYIRKFYQVTYSAAELAIAPDVALREVTQACAGAERVFIDIDCDVLDAAFFPAVVHPAPFGLSVSLLLRVLEAVWSSRVIGIGISEFDPARDQNDRSLATLLWLVEYALLKQYER